MMWFVTHWDITAIGIGAGIVWGYVIPKALGRMINPWEERFILGRRLSPPAKKDAS